IAISSPALKANFFVKEKFDISKLNDLLKLKEQIISIDLAKMPVDDNVLSTLSKFENLEILILNQTDIKGIGLEKLADCKNLEQLSIANTQVTAASLKPLLSKTQNLKIYAWSSKINPEEVAAYKNKFDFGYKPVSGEILQLNTVQLVNNKNYFENEGLISFKHSLKGVTIKYALDKEELDSLKSRTFTGPIRISKDTKIKVMAVKEGWKKSNSQEFTFYKSSITPSSIKVYSRPERQHGRPAEEILIDKEIASTSNFRDPRWVGYKKNPLDVEFGFKAGTKLNAFNLCYLVQPFERSLSPKAFEVYVKEKNKAMSLYKKITISDPKEYIVTRENLVVNFTQPNIESVRIKSIPLDHWPSIITNAKPGDTRMFSVDEVYFY
ncbi:MAG: chitobiase/beta-hexosaminidase C-terminal domain-containing protein, partial [Leadbetterella sp.]